MMRPANDRPDYKTYIRSNAWRQVRKRFWESKLPKECYICGDPSGKMDLHHRTYQRLGRERLSDLVPVHRECHEKIHQMHNHRKTLNPKANLTKSTKRARKVHGKSKRLKRPQAPTSSNKSPQKNVRSEDFWESPNLISNKKPPPNLKR